jgi:DHA1 family bicyclomycin/chloramphenicol resistance-like MFS transporter
MPRFFFRVGSRRWIVSLAALTATTALSIDMSLPAQPVLARVFAVDAGVAQLTLSLFLVGFACGQLVVGYLSDVRGRRPVLLAGLGLFTVAGAACALSRSMPVLLACRLVQGAGAASGAVIGRAMVRDTQDPAGAARLLSVMMAVLALAPMLAPVAGAWVLTHLGWRAIYATLGGCGVVFIVLALTTLPETLPLERRQPFSARAVANGFGRFFGAPGTLAPTFLVCASFAGQFAFISGSPFVLIDGYGVSPARYALYFAASAGALMIGSAVGGRQLARGAAPRRLLAVGATLLAAGGVALAVGVRVAGAGVFGFMAPVLVYFVGIGLTGPSATAVAMDPVPDVAGTASSAIGCMQMVAGAGSGYLTTRVGGADPRTVSLVILGVGVVAALLALATQTARPRASGA